MSKSKSSSGDHSKLHPYVSRGAKMFGRKGWTTSKITRDKEGKVSIKLINIEV